MRSTTKKPHSTDRAVKVIRSSKGAGDAQSRKYTRMQKKMGNSGLGCKLGEASSTRDMLVNFTCDRLRVMRNVQAKELAEIDHVREWFRRVAKGAAGFWRPDPTRWHEAARSMKEAVKAFCRGDVTRGAYLLEQGMEHERAAFDSVPVMVREKLKGEETGAAPAPAQLDSVAPATTCAARNLPEELVYADQILAITETLFNLPPIRRRRRRRRRAEEGEEAEEAEQKQGGAQAEASGATQDQDKDEEEDEEEDEETEVEHDDGKVQDQDDEGDAPPRRWWDAGD